MSSQTDKSDPHVVRPRGFFGELRNKLDACGLILSEYTHDRGRRLPKHFHKFSFISLVLNGHYVTSYGRRGAALKPFTTIFHPAGIEHQDEIGPCGTRIFNIEVRDQWLNRLDEYGITPVSSTDLQGGELTWLATRLYREFKERGSCSDLVIEAQVLEMLAILSRFPESCEKCPPPWLPRALDLLNSCFQEKLTVNSVAAEIGIHPVYLSRIFRRFCHQTIGNYLHKLRIQFALQELTKVEVDMAALAVTAGFADQSHFTRVFKDLTGITPGAFRVNLASGLPQVERKRIQDLLNCSARHPAALRPSPHCSSSACLQ